MVNKSAVQRRKRFYSNLSTGFRVGMQYGFIPLVLYLGFRKGAEEGMPPLTILSLLWS